MKLKNILLLSLSVVFLASCYKDRNDSMYDYLQGTWSLVQVGTDINDDGLMGTEEVTSLPDSSLLTTTFNGDGKGYGSININNISINAHFSWTTSEGTQRLIINTDEDTMYEADFKANDYKTFTLLARDVQLGGDRIWLVYHRK